MNTRKTAAVPVLQKGMAYTTYLCNDHKVAGTIYYACVASGKHYFGKGNEIYPAEVIVRHSINISQTRRNRKKYHKMSQKGQRTTAEALKYEDFIRLLSGLHEDKDYLWELYCCISFCTACRISDVRTMTWQDVLEKNVLFKIEQKTGKMRQITLSGNVQQRIVDLYEQLGSPDKHLPVICNTRTEKPYSKQYINERLKLFRWKYKLPIKRFSSHSFRKTFGRYIYETMGRTMEALILLSNILRHTSPRVTMVYLGIREEEIEGVYNTIQLDY